MQWARRCGDRERLGRCADPALARPGRHVCVYERLGFEEVGLWPGEYLIVMRSEAGVHFFHSPSLHPYSSDAGCYVYVEDADSLHAEFSRLDLPGESIPRLHGPPSETDYGLREVALVDPHGNLLRIGSPLRR